MTDRIWCCCGDPVQPVGLSSPLVESTHQLCGQWTGTTLFPSHRFQWSSTQSSTENEREVLPLPLGLRGIACQLNKSHVTKSQCLGGPQTNFLTCRPAVCLTGCHSCGLKTG
ncbi:uncharacterized protein BO88DRAFT_140018 [Aspergillus vadensis CBS 113365]|uniref:Uncharacterized protein n=1 Tax=Aspergillus vadensis (strain CBS 113365 / IMI 142717 / IBT 24658) TaxID=1448311 RepID=A0A319B591_ASPVC|nr:hypothetical protein BO88DRAFT_140018 [Aspergillus vadensis CBS 113365]PYH65440.1 hypothetical protein BO88DRAFT_140018 [Aspergillus vadensis CBS 113365]